MREVCARLELGVKALAFTPVSSGSGSGERNASIGGRSLSSSGGGKEGSGGEKRASEKKGLGANLWAAAAKWRSGDSSERSDKAEMDKAIAARREEETPLASQLSANWLLTPAGDGEDGVAELIQVMSSRNLSGTVGELVKDLSVLDNSSVRSLLSTTEAEWGSLSESEQRRYSARVADSFESESNQKTRQNDAEKHDRTGDEARGQASVYPSAQRRLSDPHATRNLFLLGHLLFARETALLARQGRPIPSDLTTSEGEGIIGASDRWDGEEMTEMDCYENDAGGNTTITFLPGSSAAVEDDLEDEEGYDADEGWAHATHTPTTSNASSTIQRELTKEEAEARALQRSESLRHAEREYLEHNSKAPEQMQKV